MDDLMEKLQSVLNDEESMKQIKELAEMLSAETENSGDGDQPQENSSGQSGVNDNIASLLQGLGGSQTPAAQNGSGDGGFDIGKMMQLGQIMQSAAKPDKNVALLLALKPLLKDENQEKIDRIIKLFKLMAIYPALKESGLLGGDLFGLL